MLEKPKRKKNKNLLRSYRFKQCLVCGLTPTDPHHLKSVGAGGDDSEENLIPLCRLHHSEIHQKGLNRMLQDYPNFRLAFNYRFKLT